MESYKVNVKVKIFDINELFLEFVKVVVFVEDWIMLGMCLWFMYKWEGGLYGMCRVLRIIEWLLRRIVYIFKYWNVCIVEIYEI